MNRRPFLAATVLAVAAVSTALTLHVYADAPAARPSEIPATINNGFDTDARDRGRPVVLIAAALGVPADVFREAFSHVLPAQGRGPTGDEARRNKDELLGRLAKYGVTNERLDEVSDYYRYRRENGELWKHKPAVVFARVKDGAVVGFRVADAGAGYSSAPSIVVEGLPSVAAKVRLHFDKELTKNGSIEAVTLAPPATAP